MEVQDKQRTELKRKFLSKRVKKKVRILKKAVFHVVQSPLNDLNLFHCNDTDEISKMKSAANVG